MKNFLFIFLFAALFSVSNAAQTKDAKIKSEIEKVLNEQKTAWNVGSIDGYMKGYWNSPQLVFVSGASVTKGWQPTLDRYKKRYDSRAKMGVLTFSDLEINVLSKDSAVVLGSWALKTEGGDDPHGKFTLIFRKFKDGWKIVHDHTS